jgi:hypothetical protein
MSILYNALLMKPCFVSPGGDETKPVHSQHFVQVHDKQWKSRYGTACAVEVLAFEMKAVHPNLYAQKEYRK